MFALRQLSRGAVQLRAYSAAANESKTVVAVLYKAGDAAKEPRLLGKPCVPLRQLMHADSP